MDMIERVARALCKADGHSENTKFEGKPMWVSYSENARFVIGTMREPTEAMKVAWQGNSPGGSTPERDWNAMIDAALARPPQS